MQNTIAELLVAKTHTNFMRQSSIYFATTEAFDGSYK